MPECYAVLKEVEYTPYVHTDPMNLFNLKVPIVDLFITINNLRVHKCLDEF